MIMINRPIVVGVTAGTMMIVYYSNEFKYSLARVIDIWNLCNIIPPAGNKYKAFYIQ